MFFSKTSSIIVLRAGSLSIYSLKEQQAEKLLFTPDIVKKTIIGDKEHLLEVIEEFLARNCFTKQRAILVLGPDAIVEKKILAGEANSLQDTEKAFRKTLPFPTDDTVVKQLKDNHDIFFIAANKMYFETIANIFEDLGWKIELIVPFTLFDGIENKDDFTDREVKKILSNTHVLSIGSFALQHTAITRTMEAEKEIDREIKEDVPVKREAGSKKIFIIIGIVIILVLVGVLVFISGVGASLKEKIAPAPTPTTAPSPTAAPTPTTAPVSREKLTVQVINGTGVVGQAGRVKTQLEKFGYKEVKTGNKEDADKTAPTEIIFKSTVAKTERDALIKELGDSFDTIEAKDATKDASFDIVVTTGK